MKAVVQLHKNGTVFPVEYNIASESEAARRVRWMQQGPSATEDWRAIPMIELRALMEAGKVDLSCFTVEAQNRMRKEIMEARS